MDFGNTYIIKQASFEGPFSFFIVDWEKAFY